jgi:hypothetical protein
MATPSKLRILLKAKARQGMVSRLTNLPKTLVLHKHIMDKGLPALVDTTTLAQSHRVATTVHRATIRAATMALTLRNLPPTPTHTLKDNTINPLAVTTSTNNQVTIRDLPADFNHNKAHMEELRNHPRTHTKGDHRRIIKTSSIKPIPVNLHTTRELVILVLHRRAIMAGSRLTLAGGSAPHATCEAQMY